MGRATTYIDRLAAEILDTVARLTPSVRYFLGITGSPASGKSTLAHELTTAVNRRVHGDVAVVVPMDGFHLPNKVLHERGLYPLKGIPDTFDAESFVLLLERLHECPYQTVHAPSFDHAKHDPVHDEIAIQPSHRLIVAEGNYLLHDEPPWDPLRTLLDEVWYVDAPRVVTAQRLLERHMKAGRSREEAEEKIVSTDLPNAEIIERTRPCADRIIGSSNISRS
jgi:pantothenate kinase